MSNDYRLNDNDIEELEAFFRDMDPQPENPSTVTTEAPISNDEPSENLEEEDFYDYENDYEDPEEESVIEEIPWETPEEPTLIPVNSESAISDEYTSRFSGAIWYNAIQSKSITLAGVGGIGSYVAFLLSRVKPASVHLWDDDRVDSSNISGQMFPVNSVGTTKVQAAFKIMKDFSSYFPTMCYVQKFTSNSHTNKIMIGGFDNMEARTIFFNVWKSRVDACDEEEKKEYLLIDGRLAAEEFQVLCLRGDDTFNIQRYMDEFLFSSAEAEETVCSYKQTSFMANMIASVMVNLFVNFVANECDPVIDRDLPFITEYNAELMYFNTEN